MITDDKITEIFCLIDEFCKFFDQGNGKKLLIGSEDGKKRRMWKTSMSESEIMTVLILFHFGSFRNFKHFYLFFIKEDARIGLSDGRVLQPLRGIGELGVLPDDVLP